MKVQRNISFLLLIIAAWFAVIEITDHHDGKIFKLIIAVLVLANIPAALKSYLGKWKIFSSQWFLPVVFAFVSVLITAFVFRAWHFPLFDDAGFTLRYLDNFARGYFYRFNITDPPVFGLSSFSQGIINGVICWLHLLSPDKSLLVTSAFGMVIICFLLFKILEQYHFPSDVFILSSTIILFGSKFFLNSMTTGMEPAIHLAVVLTAIYFFIKDNSKMMWLMLSASVISKLDAVPLAVTLGFIHLCIHRKNYLPVSFRNKSFVQLIYFVVIPVGAWIAFATVVFGSPLPQSAYAKVFLHAHADDYWFPFFKYFFKDEFRRPVFLIFLVLFAWNIRLVAVRNNSVGVNTLAFGLSFFSTLVLYYFYNPFERMTWYYAMPDLFLIAQTAISFNVVILREARLSFQPFIIYCSFIAASLLLLYDAYGGRAWLKAYLTTVEQERIDIGKYLKSITTEKDTVLVAHGHIARYTPAYVIDMTGLNSKYPTRYKNNLAIVAANTKPAFAVSHGTDYFIRTLDSLGYSLTKSWYDIDEYYWPVWRLFSRHVSEENRTHIVIPDSTQCKAREIRKNFGLLVCFGDTVTINLPDDTTLAEIRFGVKRISRTRNVIMTVLTANDTLAKAKQTLAAERDSISQNIRYTDEASIHIDSTTARIKNKKLVLTSSVKEELKIIEPLFLMHHRN